MGHAVPVSGLYSSVVQVPASLDSQQLLDQAFYQAIDEVLVRVSGQESGLTGGVLQSAHKSVASWVAQHSVKETVSDASDVVQEVSVTFYKESVDRFLFDHNLPVWGSNRPSILVWMIEQEAGSRRMLGAKQSSNTLSSLFDQSKLYGLPLYAPLVDDVDRNNLDGSALWGFFENDILAASQRYQTDVVLAVRVQEQGGGAMIEGTLLSPNQKAHSLTASGATKTEAVNKLLQQLSSVLSNRYASIKTATPNDMFVKVDGVHDYRAMASLKDYLASIGVVRQVQLIGIVGGQVEFTVVLDGTVDKFKNSVALNGMLATKPLATEGPSLAPVVEYQYVGEGSN